MAVNAATLCGKDSEREISRATNLARELLKRGRSVLERGARELLEAESLGEAELLQLKQELPARKDVIARKTA